MLTRFEPLVQPHKTGVKTTRVEPVLVMRIEPVQITRIEPFLIKVVTKLKKLCKSLDNMFTIVYNYITKCNYFK